MSYSNKNNKRRPVYRTPKRNPQGLLLPWVFKYLRHWGTPRVLYMDDYRAKIAQRKEWWKW